MESVTQTIDNIIEATPGYSLEKYLEDKGIKPAESAPAKRLLTSEEARLYLGGISRMTLHRLTSRGEIPLVRIGTRTLLDPDDLDAFIRQAKRRSRNRRAGGPKT